MSNSSTIWAWPWWSVMVFTNLVNLVICGILYKRSLTLKDRRDVKYRNWMRNMGAIFTLVGAYRSVFVSKYGPQMAWFDIILNSALLVRMLAIGAELSLSGLIAYTMLKVNTYVPVKKDEYSNKLSEFMTKKSPYILVICIFLAQFFATGGVITKSELFFAIEETLWLIGFLAVLPLQILQLRRVFSMNDEETVERFHIIKKSTVVVFLWSIVYINFMVFLNLPGIWADAITQLTSGVPPIRIDPNAIIDAFSIVNVTRKYGDWGFGFLIWHSGYFTLLVWLSLFLMQAPNPLEDSRKSNARSTKILLLLMTLVILILLVIITIPLIS